MLRTRRATLLVALIVIIPVVVPLVFIARELTPTAAHVSGVLTRRLWFAIWESALTVVFSLLIGGGFALWEHDRKAMPSRVFAMAMALPVFLPTAMVALGFITVWGTNGYVNNALAFFGIERVRFLYSPLAVIAANCLYNAPLAYLALHSRLASMHPYMEESARTLGATGWQVFRRITLPRVSSMTIGVSVLIFLYAFMSFAIPLILGGIGYQTPEVYIFSHITRQFDFPGASFAALFQLALLVGIILPFIRPLKDIQEPHRATLLQQTWRQSLTLWLARGVLMGYVLLPLIGVVIDGFTISRDGTTALSFASYRQLTSTRFASALGTSLTLGLAVTVLTIALVYALIFLYRKSWTATFIFFLALSPIALGYAWLLVLGKSPLAMLAAYSTITLPLAYFLARNAWRARPRSFDDMLRILGAYGVNHLYARLRYILPTLRLVAALTMTLVLGDIAVSSLLSSHAYPTAMALSYSLIGSYRFHVAAAGMSIVLATIGIMIALTHYAPRVTASPPAGRQRTKRSPFR